LAAFTSLICSAVGAGASARDNGDEGDIDAVIVAHRQGPIRAAGEDRKSMAVGLTIAFFSVRRAAILVNWYAARLSPSKSSSIRDLHDVAERRKAQESRDRRAAGSLPTVGPWVAATGSLSVSRCVFMIIFFGPAAFYGRCAVPFRRLRDGRDYDVPVTRSRRDAAAVMSLYIVLVAGRGARTWPLG